MDALRAAPVHVVAATLPGFGRTPHQADFSVENYASLAGQLARELRADIVGGHSLGGNVALEMAARGEFDGHVLLLSPTFSREDEAKELGVRRRPGGRAAGVAGDAQGDAEGDGKAVPRRPT
jgi:pimeloyl-ACP methyl ester carboxylesterase